MSTAPSLHRRARRLPAMWPIVSILILLGVASLHAASPRVVITPGPGFSIAWDGNNGGGFNNPAAGAGPSNNVALASNGTVPFTSSDLGPQLGIPFHVAANLNDGLYGNSFSWISGDGDAGPFAGLRFAASVNISSIAWGRDNGNTVSDACGGTCTDRTLGVYRLQFTQVPAPDRNTPETGDAATGWADIGTVEYLPGPEDASFTSYLRHRFDVAEGGGAIAATGLRIKVPVAGLAGGTDIDEIEVNPIPDLISPIPPITNFIEITPAAGFAINWDRNEGKNSTPNNPAPVPVNDASTSRGASPFTSSDLGPAINVPFHRAVNLNDGFYGNANSWIPNFIGGDPTPFAGINLGRRRLVSSVAWGRDNGNVAGDCCGGTLTDRALGVYILQITTAPNPGPATPEACGPTPDSGWVTVGTINYKANDPVYFNSYLRHRFDLTQGGAPVAATGIRLKVPNAQSAIDEIEINPNLAFENGALVITSAPDASIAWDGNDGQFNNPAVDAAPPPNRALASEGTTPFSSSDLGPLLSIPFHRAVNLNDGRYGNANSWISANGVGGNSDPDPFVGLNFGGTVGVTNIAWGRDNGNVAGDCCGGTAMDRSLDTYRLQFTAVPAPDAATPDTGDAATGWQDIGTVLYASAAPPFFTPYLRHRFDLGAGGLPLDATGIRIKVANGNTAIDEIEINTSVGAPPPPSPVGIAPAAGYSITWDGNDGHYQNPATGARPPANRALAIQGSIAFSSSDLGPVLAIPFHVAGNINDGLYGNANSWISANGIGGASDPDPSVGVNFNGTVAIRNLAWSRDNGDAAEGNFTDRALGTYTIQITSVAAPGSATPETGDPATGWANLGTVEYRGAAPGDFTPHLRHRFEVSAGGQPIDATGLRIKVSNGQMDLDELEVNTAGTPPPCCNAEPTFTLAGNATASDEDAGPVSVTGWLANLSAGPNEPNQTLTLHVSNNNPALFAVQPSISPAGVLTYTAVAGASGLANVRVYVTDDGGTGVCGDDTSVAEEFVIQVRPANDCPVASPASLTVMQNGSVSFQLAGSDPDGDALQFEITQLPAHGSASVGANTGAGSYTPNPGYCGPDSFRYRVSDGLCRSDEVTVSITVTCLNRCPTAVVEVSPECALLPGTSTILVIAGNNTNACVLLDGSLSSDPDGDALTYSWYAAGALTPFASGAMAVACLDVGPHALVLLVDDGRCTHSKTVEVEVITPCDAVDVLIAAVNEADLDRRNKRPLIASLKAACASFDRGDCGAAANQLRSFTNKVRAQIARDNPVAAAEFIRLAQRITDCVHCPE